VASVIVGSGICKTKSPRINYQQIQTPRSWLGWRLCYACASLCHRSKHRSSRSPSWSDCSRRPTKKLHFINLFVLSCVRGHSFLGPGMCVSRCLLPENSNTISREVVDRKSSHSDPMVDWYPFTSRKRRARRVVPFNALIDYVGMSGCSRRPDFDSCRRRLQVATLRAIASREPFSLPPSSATLGQICL